MKVIYSHLLSLAAHISPSTTKTTMIERIIDEAKIRSELKKTTLNPDFNNLRKVSRVLILSLNLELKRQLQAKKRNWLGNNGFLTYMFLLSKLFCLYLNFTNKRKLKKLNFVDSFETAQNLTELNSKNVVYIICSLTHPKFAYFGSTVNWSRRTTEHFSLRKK